MYRERGREIERERERYHNNNQINISIILCNINTENNERLKVKYKDHKKDRVCAFALGRHSSRDVTPRGVSAAALHGQASCKRVFLFQRHR